MRSATAGATELIKEHEDVLHACARLLLEKEKIGRTEFEALFGIVGDDDPGRRKTSGRVWL